jgi:oligopeptide/dipeptide ABC transporter ATP-binding protein
VQALMGLIPRPPGRITSGSVKLSGSEILGGSVREFNRIRGKEIGMIFQDPMTSLNPTMSVGRQISETLRIHDGYGESAAHKRAIELLELVQIPEAATRVDHFPFQFSGGMRQRVMIAMAIACQPKVLIADEPTTALDVTIQSQILALLKDLQRELSMSIILITHDLGVVATIADDVAVMYAGQIVEAGSIDDVFYRACHPYTAGLRQAMPDPGEGRRKKLVPIDGAPPDLFSPPRGCAYYDRCPNAMRTCENRVSPLFDMRNGAVEAAPFEEGQGTHVSRCWLHHPNAGAKRRLVSDLPIGGAQL